MAEILGKTTTEETEYTTVNSNMWIRLASDLGAFNYKISGTSLKTDMSGTESDTIVAGEIVISNYEPNDLITVDTEGAAASDNLDTIHGGHDGQIIILQAANSAHTIVIRDNAVGGGNIITAGAASFSLDNTKDKWMGVITDGRVDEISRSNNGV